MLHIKRENGEVVYKMSKHMSLSEKHEHPIITTPTLTQPNTLTFNGWYEKYKNDVDNISEAIIASVMKMQSDRYIIKVHDTEQLRQDISKWVYRCSNNKLKHF